MASGQLPPQALAGVWSLGELGLDGSLRPVRGVLPVALAARAAGARALVVPDANGAEAALVDQLLVWPAACLVEALALLRGSSRPRVSLPLPAAVAVGTALDLAGTGRACDESLWQAVQLCRKLALQGKAA